MDFFVSYSSKDKEQVYPIVEELEKIGAQCWIAPRDVLGNYAVAINKAIGNCKVFLLCLSKNSANSEHVLNEIEMVYRHNKRRNTPIPISPLCLEPMDIDDPCLDIIMYYISKINFISPQTYGAQDIAQEVLLKNDNILHLKKCMKRPREKSLYFDSKREDKRLMIQDELCQKFDYEIYERIISSYASPRILDVGCGNGRMLMTRLGKINPAGYRYLGIDREASKIQEASASYPEASFMELDVESKNFQEQLCEAMESMSYEKFDIINISMLLLHLKNQCRLFRILRRVLASGGTIIIKDIDDGLNIAYPDSNAEF